MVKKHGEKKHCVHNLAFNLSSLSAEWNRPVYLHLLFRERAGLLQSSPDMSRWKRSVCYPQFLTNHPSLVMKYSHIQTHTKIIWQSSNCVMHIHGAKRRAETRRRSTGVTVMQKQCTRVMEEIRKIRQLLSVDGVFLDGTFAFWGVMKIFSLLWLRNCPEAKMAFRETSTH